MDTFTPERIQLAVEAFQPGSLPSKRSAASAFNVPWSAFRDRLAGVQTNRASKQHMQRLTPEQEASICRIIQQMHLWGCPIGIASLECFAQQLLAQKGDFEPLGIYNTLLFISNLLIYHHFVFDIPKYHHFRPPLTNIPLLFYNM
jgi:hypothetical protein